jgi:hypothetical protein
VLTFAQTGENTIVLLAISWNAPAEVMRPGAIHNAIPPAGYRDAVQS